MTKNSSKETHLRFAVLATDVVLFTIYNNELYVRLIAVDRPPYFPKGSKGFPGGLIAPEETADEAAARHIAAKAGISAKKIYLEQLYTFSSVKRDPRGRVVAVSYLALVPWEKLSEAERENSKESWWSKISEATKLAYDHDEMLSVAVKRLRSKIQYSTVISKILPGEFTLTELERAYETILEEDLDKRNFRKKIAKLNILKELPHKRTGESFRPARIYKFVSSKVEEIEII